MKNRLLFEHKHITIQQYEWILLLPTIIIDTKYPMIVFEFLFWSITFYFYNRNE